jgi:hypothetical protein
VGDAKIFASIKETTQGHPFWGYRRVRAWLKNREGIKRLDNGLLISSVNKAI